MCSRRLLFLSALDLRVPEGFSSRCRKYMTTLVPGLPPDHIHMPDQKCGTCHAAMIAGHCTHVVPGLCISRLARARLQPKEQDSLPSSRINKMSHEYTLDLEAKIGTGAKTRARERRLDEVTAAHDLNVIVFAVIHISRDTRSRSMSEWHCPSSIVLNSCRL